MTRPRFETVSVPLPTPSGASPQRAIEVAVGLIGRSYQATDQPGMQLVGERSLFCFGRAGLHRQICLDVNDGTVVEYIGSNDGPVRFMNSSIEAFNRCVEAAIRRYPYYGLNSDLSDRHTISTELAEQIAAIDPAALADKDSFWSTFVDDVEIGDYASDTAGLE